MIFFDAYKEMEKGKYIKSKNGDLYRLIHKKEWVGIDGALMKNYIVIQFLPNQEFGSRWIDEGNELFKFNTELAFSDTWSIYEEKD